MARLKDARYRDAVNLIAHGDDPKETNVERIEQVGTTRLVAALFGANVTRVASDVVRVRAEAIKVEARRKSAADAAQQQLHDIRAAEALRRQQITLDEALELANAGTHGSADLDADAAKLRGLGADPGLTVEDLAEVGA